MNQNKFNILKESPEQFKIYKMTCNKEYISLYDLVMNLYAMYMFELGDTVKVLDFLEVKNYKAPTYLCNYKIELLPVLEYLVEKNIYQESKGRDFSIEPFFILNNAQEVYKQIITKYFNEIFVDVTGEWFDMYQYQIIEYKEIYNKELLNVTVIEDLIPNLLHDFDNFYQNKIYVFQDNYMYSVINEYLLQKKNILIDQLKKID